MAIQGKKLENLVATIDQSIFLTPQWPERSVQSYATHLQKTKLKKKKNSVTTEMKLLDMRGRKQEPDWVSLA